ncbi:hypothetical protein ACWD4G_03610 [Streptomyces sp. NPDC002643]
MTFKMTWAMAGEHADEWTGFGYGEAGRTLRDRVGAAVAASGMSSEAQEHFRTTFIAPLVKGIATEGYDAMRAGRQWSKAAGPLLVVLTPAA